MQSALSASPFSSNQHGTPRVFHSREVALVGEIPWVHDMTLKKMQDPMPVTYDSKKAVCKAYRQQILRGL